jgi:hypothetical protein
MRAFNPSRKPATSSRQTSAETYSRLPDMSQIKWTRLYRDETAPAT